MKRKLPKSKKPATRLREAVALTEATQALKENLITIDESLAASQRKLNVLLQDWKALGRSMQEVRELAEGAPAKASEASAGNGE